MDLSLNTPEAEKKSAKTLHDSPSRSTHRASKRRQSLRKSLHINAIEDAKATVKSPAVKRVSANT